MVKYGIERFKLWIKQCVSSENSVHGEIDFWFLMNQPENYNYNILSVYLIILHELRRKRDECIHKIKIY